MSRASVFTRSPRNTLFVTIGARCIACGMMVRESGQTSWVSGSLYEVCIDTAGGLGAAIEKIIDALRKAQAVQAAASVDQVRVVIADVWLAVTCVPWNSDAKRAETSEAYARNQLVAEGFDVEAADLLKLDDMPFGEPRLAVVYPRTTLALLERFAHRLDTRLASVIPLSVAAWIWARHKVGARLQALAVQDAGLMLLAHGVGATRSRLNEVALRTYADDSDSSDDGLGEFWRRLCLRNPHLAKVQQPALLDLRGAGRIADDAEKAFVAIDFADQYALPDSIAVSAGLKLAAACHSSPHALDALPNAPAMNIWRWLVLGGSALLAIGGVTQTLQTYFSIQASTARLNAVTNAVKPVASPITWSREDRARVGAVNAAIRELNLPISGILHALQPPPDIHVAVLSVETDGGSSIGRASSVKITAEARMGADMARYVAFVADRKPFVGAYLTKHEINEDEPEHPYRFTMEASWSE